MGDVDGAFETCHEMDKRGCAQDVVDTCIMMIDGLFRYNKAEDACFPVEDIVKFPYQKFDHPMARRFALNEKRTSLSVRGKYGNILSYLEK